MSGNIRWGEMFYELRHKFAPRDHEIQGGTIVMHPRDRNELYRADGLSPMLPILDMSRTDPPMVMGWLYLRTSVLLPEGLALVCARDTIVASINLDTGTITCDDIPEGITALA